MHGTLTSPPPPSAPPPLPDPNRLLAGWARELWTLAAGVVEDPAGRLLLGLLVALVLAGRPAWRRLRAAARRRGARYVEVLAPAEVDPAGAGAFWRNLHGLLRQRRFLAGRPHVAFEYAWSAGRLRIGLWVPGTVPPRAVERAVEAAWPGARTAVTAPAQPLPPNGRVLGGELRLAAAEWYPLHTDHRTDPLRALLGAAGELGPGEATVVQVLARPAAGRRLARARRAARALRAGLPASPAARALDLLLPGPTHRRAAGDPGRTAAAREVLAKAAGPAFEGVVRYAVAAAPGRRPGGRLRARAHALAAAFALHAGRNQLTRRRLARPAACLAARELGRGDLLSLAEVAALAHLPWDAAVPGLRRAGARAVAPAPGVPAEGLVLGEADAGPARPVALHPQDARQHLHVLGATGAGKSTLLANLILQDAAAGRGVVVVDPKGDLVADLLGRLPARADGRLVLLDPDDPDAPPTLNLLEGPDPDLAVDHVVGILRRIFAAWWGPRTDDVLRAACLTLLASGPATLADVPRLLAEPGFRQRRTSQLADPVLRGFWDWYESLTPAGQAQAVGPVLSRLRAVLLRRFPRQVLSAATSSFDMARVLDGGLLLARVPKGALGEDTARLLGSLVVAKVWLAAQQRARLPEPARRDASLYVDEAHNFLNLPYRLEELLPEARGYRLSLTLAHQFLAQLPRELREAVSANARSKVIFAVSPEDASALERHVTPALAAHDLAHLDAYQAAARLVAGAAELPACTLRTRPLPPPVPGRAEQARAAARRAFGRTPGQRRAEANRRELAAADAIREPARGEPGPRPAVPGAPPGRPAGRSGSSPPGALGPAGGRRSGPAGRGTRARRGSAADSAAAPSRPASPPGGVRGSGP